MAAPASRREAGAFPGRWYAALKVGQSRNLSPAYPVRHAVICSEANTSNERRDSCRTGSSFLPCLSSAVWVFLTRGRMSVRCMRSEIRRGSSGDAFS